jgi:hypothetical protein
VRQQLLDAIYSGQPFKQILRDLGLTSNQVWGLTKTDQEWFDKLEAALMATRRTTSSTELTPPMWPAVSSANAAVIKGSGWRSGALNAVS